MTRSLRSCVMLGLSDWSVWLPSSAGTTTRWAMRRWTRSAKSATPVDAARGGEGGPRETSGACEQGPPAAVRESQLAQFVERPTLDLVAMREEHERIVEEEVAAGRMEWPGPEMGPFGVASVDWWV